MASLWGSRKQEIKRSQQLWSLCGPHFHLRMARGSFFFCVTQRIRNGKGGWGVPPPTHKTAMAVPLTLQRCVGHNPKDTNQRPEPQSDHERAQMGEGVEVSKQANSDKNITYGRLITPLTTRSSNTLSNAAESDPPASMMGYNISNSSPNRSETRLPSRALIQFLFPRTVLISPISGVFVFGCRVG